tara:strand:- start:234 stop:563 length:330 start_codon:yes stop_codon:yes gene_type:complete
MKRLFILSLIISFFLLISQSPVNAKTKYEMYLSDFYLKQEQASKILKEIETDLKNGSRNKVCQRQREAANFGIQATNSLIKAFEINGSISDIENLQSGLNKWKELRDYC